MSKLPDARPQHHADYAIEGVFLQRWSPRAMSGEPISEQELMTILEAARWAPSTFNEQEWRYLYARRDTPAWHTHFSLLAAPNQVWCKNAAVLLVVLSKKTFTQTGKPNPVHTFDAGLSCENLMLQATAMGLASHGMAGFDRDKARKDLKVPEDYAVEAMVAVGHYGDPDQLPEQLRSLEHPSGRKKIEEFAREGEFNF